MKNILLAVFFLVPCTLFGQDLTGTWIGKGGGTTYIKLVVRHNNDSLIGYTYDEAYDGSWCKATFFGYFSKGQRRVVGKGGELIEWKGSHVVTTYDWVYSKEGDGEYLRARRSSSSSSNSLLDLLFGSSDEEAQWLRRVSKTPEKLPVENKKVNQAPPTTPPAKPKTTTPPATPKPPVKKETTTPKEKPKDTIVKQEPIKIEQPKIPEVKAPEHIINEKKVRSSKLVRTINTASDSIQLYIYDNGEIDNDTVTVFFDDKVILDRYMISDKAKVITLPISKDKEHVIELFANNLGTIPPNTALIVITDGKKRHELFASYDLKTNAKIVIRYGKEE